MAGSRGILHQASCNERLNVIEYDEIQCVRRTFMSVLVAAFLGVVQGLAEFLPISSSGHIMLFEQLFSVGMDESALMLVTVLLHLGTLFAVVVVFWEDWMAILRHFFHSKTLFLLILASLPALVVKVLLGDVFDKLNEGGLLGVFFLVTGLLLVFAERLSMRGRHAVKEAPVTVKNALAMGGFQAVGMLSGISRSGITILGGVATGLPRYSAAKFSFLMSAPAILGGLIVEGKDAVEKGAMTYLSSNLLPVFVGMVCAAVCGYLAIRYMLRLINRISFNWFALYMFLLGIATLVMQLLGVGALKPVGL